KEKQDGFDDISAIRHTPSLPWSRRAGGPFGRPHPGRMAPAPHRKDPCAPARGNPQGHRLASRKFGGRQGQAKPSRSSVTSKAGTTTGPPRPCYRACRKYIGQAAAIPFSVGFFHDNVVFEAFLVRQQARRTELSSGPQSRGRSLVFFLVPDFTLLPFTAAVETLRIANRMLGHEAYTWRLCSADGEKVRSSAGIALEVNASVADERRNLAGENRPNMVLVCSGIEIERYHNKTVNAWLRESYNRGIAVGSLCTGAHVLAQAGLLNDKRCAIHWENLPGFAEAFPKVEVYADLYEVDGNIHTCAGGTASLDMML